MFDCWEPIPIDFSTDSQQQQQQHRHHNHYNSNDHLQERQKENDDRFNFNCCQQQQQQQQHASTYYFPANNNDRTSGRQCTDANMKYLEVVEEASAHDHEYQHQYQHQCSADFDPTFVASMSNTNTSSDNFNFEPKDQNASDEKNNSSHDGFVTTPLIMQVLNDEKKRLDASIQSGKKEAESAQNGNIHSQRGRLGGTKLRTLLRTDPTLASLIATMKPQTLSFGDQFEFYRHHTDLDHDCAKPGSNGFPGNEELERFLKRGHEADENGLYPIHEACIKYPQNAKLIGMMIRSAPKCTEYQVKRRIQLSLRRRSLSEPTIKESYTNTIHPLKKRKSEGLRAASKSTGYEVKQRPPPNSNLPRRSLSDPAFKKSNTLRPQKKRKSERLLLDIPEAVTSTGRELSGQTKNDHLNFLVGMHPIHICVANGASMEVLKLLVRANPEVLSSPDANGMVPLSLAFKYHWSVKTEYFYEMVNLLLLTANPDAAKVPDLRSNTSLHYACMTYIQAGGLRQWHPCNRSASSVTESMSSTSHQVNIPANENDCTNSCNSQKRKMQSSPFSSMPSPKTNSKRIIPFEIIRGLTEAYPDAIHLRNFNGHSPLDLAESNGEVDDSSITFLQNIAYGVEQDVEEPPLNFF